MSPSILILCPDFITERMAGPAIRYWEFANILASSHGVTLAIPNEVLPPLQSITSAHLVQHTEDNIPALIQKHDIILFQGYILDKYPQLRHTNKILIADLYDPIPLEGLEQCKGTDGPEVLNSIQHQIKVINDQLKTADYFLCASERQRDLWLGHLLALGRINPLSYQQMQHRVLTIPFGLPDNPPQSTGPGFRQALGIETGLVLLWGGGIWEWFDPLTVIRAIHRSVKRYPNVRLIFLGTQHPNPTIPSMPMQKRAEVLSQELGLYGHQVIFQKGWVAYHAVQNHFLEADVGVSAHFDTLETHFSFRTRILHYLWAGKPIITTQGDILAKEVSHANAGIIVDYEDESAWVDAIAQLHDPQLYATYTEGAKILADSYRWSKVTQPLLKVCQSARLSPDIFLENDFKRVTIKDWENEYYVLQKEHDALKHYVDVIEHSNSWWITTPLRTLRRWLTKIKHIN